MNAKNKSVKFLCVFLLAGMLLSLFTGCAPANNNEPALSAEEKAALNAECMRLKFYYGDIAWYDEDPTLDFSDSFHRYCGTYGDAVVILVSYPRESMIYLPGATKPEESEESRVPVPSDLEVHGRTITYPAQCYLLVFNPNHVVPSGDYSLKNAAVRPFELSYVEEWMTSEQMDQALDDLEKWIAEKT